MLIEPSGSGRVDVENVKPVHRSRGDSDQRPTQVITIRCRGKVAFRAERSLLETAWKAMQSGDHSAIPSFDFNAVASDPAREEEELNDRGADRCCGRLPGAVWLYFLRH